LRFFFRGLYLPFFIGPMISLDFLGDGDQMLPI